MNTPLNKESLEQYLQRRLAKTTAVTYHIVITNFLNANPKADTYQYKDIVNHFVGLEKRYPNVSNRIKMLSMIKQYYDYLIEIKQRDDHPCKTFQIKGRNIGKGNPIQFQDLFSPTELDKLLDRENRYSNLLIRNKIILSLLIYQGLTNDEIIRLEVKDIDFDSSTIYIKGSSKLNRRTLKLQRVQLEWMNEYLKSYRKTLINKMTSHLIVTKRGNSESIEAIGRMLRPLKYLYPERVLNTTTIRMSVIANWLNAYKYRLEEVQEWAGHKWPSTTLRYKRSDIAEQRVKINMWHPLK